MLNKGVRATMTVPNLLTFFRIILTPLLAWLLLNNRLNHALIVFFLAGITDGLDGLIARVLNQKSALGAYLDPIADKLLLVTSFVLLGKLGYIPLWLIVVAVLRDVMIVFGLGWLMLKGIRVRIQPALVSKLTTAAQLLSVFLAMSSGLVRIHHLVFSVLFICTGVVTVASGIHYFRVGMVFLRGEPPRGVER